MNRKIGRRYMFLLIPILLIAGGVGFFRYSNLFVFQKVVIEPENHAMDDKKLNFPVGRNLFALPIENAVDNLLAQKNVYKVDLDYSLPDGIIIRINDIKPVALVIGENGKTRFRLSENNCFLPINTAVMQYDFPIITGLKNCRAYTASCDVRLKLITGQLRCLKKQHPDFYLAVSCIDLSKAGFISVYSSRRNKTIIIFNKFTVCLVAK